MSVTAPKLTKTTCPGAGRWLRLNGAQETFRQITCPECNRANLGVDAFRMDPDNAFQNIGRVPPHSAKVQTAADIRLEGTRMVSETQAEDEAAQWWYREYRRQHGMR